MRVENGDGSWGKDPRRITEGEEETSGPPAVTDRSVRSRLNREHPETVLGADMDYHVDPPEDVRYTDLAVNTGGGLGGTQRRRLESEYGRSPSVEGQLQLY